METTFYSEDNTNTSLKSSMSLDFSKHKKLLLNGDINFAPDLERIVIQQDTGATLTPTTQILFPRSVTEEQEAYARGFVDALEELHRKQQMQPGDDGVSQNVKTNNVNVIGLPAFSQSHEWKNALPTYTTLTTMSASGQGSRAMGSLSGAIKNRLAPSMTAAPYAPPSTYLPVPVQSALHGGAIKEEPQTVPCLSGYTPPISPINMEDQERIKLERKRSRNRLAATRCRNRKLERISRLEERVAELKSQNGGLQQTVGSLRQEVTRLKHCIVEHSSRGCKLMLTS